MVRSRVAVGIYVHIPFCASKCVYCDFVSYPGLDDLHDAYIEALLKEIASSPELPVRTIYFGGGTPTVLPATHLARVLAALHERFDVEDGAEITCEANPESAQVRKLSALRAAGFNRLSIGVQSLDDEVLRSLGRRHDAATARRAVGSAREAGFENVSIDLMYAGPGETTRSWQRTLEGAIALEPDHISAYCLTVEETTPLAARVASGSVTLSDEDTQAEMMEAAADMLTRAGYERYEISNFARSGFRCRHNVDCWSYRDYRGFGAAAHSKLAGERFANTTDVRAYIDPSAGFAPGCCAWRVPLSPADEASEAAILGLRMVDGMSTPRLSAIWRDAGIDVRPRLEALAADGLIQVSSSVRMTRRGLALANSVFREFV